MEGFRVDKWLWSVRIFKTRSQATDACRKGKVKIDEQEVKPSREVRIGDIIKTDLKIFEKTVEVKELLDKRVSAKLVDKYMNDLTPQEEYDKPKKMRETNYEYRERGAGRPTKKERRMIDYLKRKKF
ncbi:MAG: RNA-binding S4 domain-containing protein [Bacteroidales bacterium]|nr:RNA-binding S4 domain-containing protein [Bacteroidales bacterium]MCF8386469.1 RNA-binding S4 domain-containing protein [Bacteroidales bacterium]MCF8399415.1 RNA-binding S4 domain-containing protein [Bacteroidales bacterium]